MKRLLFLCAGILFVYMGFDLIYGDNMYVRWFLAFMCACTAYNYIDKAIHPPAPIEQVLSELLDEIEADAKQHRKH